MILKKCCLSFSFVDFHNVSNNLIKVHERVLSRATPSDGIAPLYFAAGVGGGPPARATRS